MEQTQPDIVGAIHLLRRGVEHWNDAAGGNQGLDLTHVEIRNAALANADFRNVNFDGAAFVNVDLSGADFRRAEVNGVTMTQVLGDGADLRGSSLKGTDCDRVSFANARFDGVETFELKLRRSKLTAASFRAAALSSSHVYNCDLTGATFADARIDGLVMKRIVAREAELEYLRALGARIDLPNDPLTADWLDWNTLTVPVPAEEPAHIVHAGRTYWFTGNLSDFFISHSSVDKEAFARPLADALRRRRQRVWFDESEVLAGDTLDSVITRGINGANFGVLVLSPSFFDRDWTRREYESLRHKNMFVVLHQVTREEAFSARPDLQKRRILTSDAGPDSVAEQLIDATARVPGHY